MIIFSVDYDEPNSTTYRGVIVKLNNKVVEKFNSGNFYLDMEKAKEKYVKKENINIVMCSKSVDYFIIDSEIKRSKIHKDA